MEVGSGSAIFSFLGSCRYVNGLYLISIHNGATLLEIFESLGRKCAAINSELTLLQYMAPHDHIAVTLNEDDDVRNMKPSQLFQILQSWFDFADKVCSDGGHELDVGTLTNSIDAWIHCIRGVGQKFKDAAEFRICLKNYVIASRRSFRYRRNESGKILVVCSKENCEWKIYASKHKSDNSFGIRKCNLSHSCGDDNLRSRGHSKADSSWVANVVKEKLRGEPSYRPCTMLKDIERDYEVELEYYKVWAGKEMAMHDIYGTDKGSYDKLRCGCRPLLFLDGTHIKNKYKGCLLGAVAKDANDDVFTLAYAIVDAENDSNWEWYPLHNKKHWSSVLKKAAYTSSRHEFSQHIKSIIDSMPLAQEFLVSVPSENWANSMFVGER
ncbi:uncharacterized protein LOC142525000 [Primulina tabacum]|uniref:uncharacterized protein LOC142525000 n=1 Tax=Primulina tabacum TaxID=48773 RepID=UPI003F595C30